MTVLETSFVVKVVDCEDQCQNEAASVWRYPMPIQTSLSQKSENFRFSQNAAFASKSIDILRIELKRNPGLLMADDAKPGLNLNIQIPQH